jgi:excisionase family DNA binding protein
MSAVETRPALLTVPEVAMLLRQSRASVYRKIANGTIPAVRLTDEHGPLRVPRAELVQWIYSEPETRGKR